MAIGERVLRLLYSGGVRDRKPSAAQAVQRGLLTTPDNRVRREAVDEMLRHDSGDDREALQATGTRVVPVDPYGHIPLLAASSQGAVPTARFVTSPPARRTS